MKEGKPAQYALEAVDLHKSFREPALVTILRSVSLKVYKGESVAIMGRSGEGKSTLLHILGTLESPSQGTLRIANQPATRFNRSRLRNEHIGFVFQSFHLLEDYSVLDNVLMPARIGRRPLGSSSAPYARAVELLTRVGLVDRLHFPTKLLSGGEKQRVAIARALCNNPDLILADEPSGNLDRANALIVHELLLNASRGEGKALIIVTHDEELASLCDRRLVLREGTLMSQTHKP